MQEFEVFQIEISKAYGKFEWHEDIKKVLKMAGEANQKVSTLMEGSASCGCCCSREIMVLSLHHHFLFLVLHFLNVFCWAF